MIRRAAVTFVVMAGGRGERLWPLVRADRPKVCLSPDGRRSLLRATVDRLRPVSPGAQWLIVTTQGQEAAIRACLPAPLARRVLVEPDVKNTAACITLAAAAVARDNPRQVMVVVPADHWISDAGAYQAAVRAAVAAAAARETLATIGVRPRSAHPGLGYLCAGAPLRSPRSGARAFRLARFVEKPSPARAQQLLRRPHTYWNIGTFVGRADVFLRQLTTWLPEHVRRIAPLAASTGTRGFPLRARAAYRTLPAVSFDHGVMDHLQDGVVVEGRFGWADLGSWDAWAQLNHGARRTVSVQSRNVLVVTPTDHVVAAVGVKNLVVVHTPSATLVCAAGKSQAVRDVVQRLAGDQRLAQYQ